MVTLKKLVDEGLITPDLFAKLSLEKEIDDVDDLYSRLYPVYALGDREMISITERHYGLIQYSLQDFMGMISNFVSKEVKERKPLVFI